MYKSQALQAGRHLALLPDGVRAAIAAAARALPTGHVLTRRLRKGLSHVRHSGDMRIPNLFVGHSAEGVGRRLRPDWFYNTLKDVCRKKGVKTS